MSLTTIQLLNYAAWMPDALGQLGSTWVKWLNPPAGVSAFPGQKLDVRIWTDNRDGAYIAQGEAGGRREWNWSQESKP